MVNVSLFIITVLVFESLAWHVADKIHLFSSLNYMSVNFDFCLKLMNDLEIYSLVQALTFYNLIRFDAINKADYISKTSY